MLRCRTRACVRSHLLLVAPLILWFGLTPSAAADCEHFTPFGQPIHRSLSDGVGVSVPPEWTVVPEMETVDHGVLAHLHAGSFDARPHTEQGW